MLTLVTHTRNERPELLKRAVASIEAALVPGVRHCIVECKTNWPKARQDALELDEYVAFVDDDDTITPWALKDCVAAISNTKAGLVFTDEQVVDLNGKVLTRPSKGFRTYAAIGTHPRTAHHLNCIRSDMVDPRALDLDRQYGLGIDWTISASAALRGSAIHIPRIGYSWTRHPDTMNHVESNRYAQAMVRLGQDIRALWPRNWGRVPQWLPQQEQTHDNKINPLANARPASAMGLEVPK